MPSTKYKSKSVKDADSGELIESAVMKEIYGLEKKRTTFLFTEYLILIVIFGILGLTSTIIFFSIMNQGEVFDMFELFTQDPGTIKHYFWDTIQTIYIETPKAYLLLSLIFLGGALLLLITFKKQLPSLLQKINSIKKYGKMY